MGLSEQFDRIHQTSVRADLSREVRALVESGAEIDAKAIVAALAAKGIETSATAVKFQLLALRRKATAALVAGPNDSPQNSEADKDRVRRAYAMWMVEIEIRACSANDMDYHSDPWPGCPNAE